VQEFRDIAGASFAITEEVWKSDPSRSILIFRAIDRVNPFVQPTRKINMKKWLLYQGVPYMTAIILAQNHTEWIQSERKRLEAERQAQQRREREELREEARRQRREDRRAERYYQNQPGIMIIDGSPYRYQERNGYYYYRNNTGEMRRRQNDGSGGRGGSGLQSSPGAEEEVPAEEMPEDLDVEALAAEIEAVPPEEIFPAEPTESESGEGRGLEEEGGSEEEGSLETLESEVFDIHAGAEPQDPAHG